MSPSEPCRGAPRLQARTRAVPDVSGLQSQRPAAQREAVGPLPTAPPPGLEKLLRIIVPGVDRERTHLDHICEVTELSSAHW